MTTKNSKTSKTSKTAKKSKLTDEQIAERKAATKARKVERIRLLTERQNLLEEMANAVMLGDLTSEQIVAMGEATRRDVAEVDALIEALKIRQTARKAPKGFVLSENDDGAKCYDIAIDGLDGRVSGRVDTVADEGYYGWTVVYGAGDTGAMATGKATNLKLAVAMCKAAVLVAKRAINKADEA
jgi:hypothetical protein